MNRERFIENLTKARKSRNLNQKQVANAIGISDRTYSKWETGETEPGIEQLCRLGEFYGISPADFLRDEVLGSPIRTELKTLTSAQAMLRTVDIIDEAFDGLTDNAIWWHEHWDDKVATINTEHLPVLPVQEKQSGFCSYGKDAEGFFFRYWNEDANLRLLLMPSKDGYAWIKEEAVALSKLFQNLCNVELLDLLIQSPPDRWYTPEYLSGETNLQVEQVREFLGLLIELHLTEFTTIRTAEGDQEIYLCPDTRLLRAILTLAHLLIGECRKEGEA